MFGAVFVDVFQWKHLSSMAALFMVGVFLALVREHTGHIAWGIGLHAGWVFVIQVTRRMTDGNPEAPAAFLVGTYDGIIGWLAAVMDRPAGASLLGMDTALEVRGYLSRASGRLRTISRASVRSQSSPCTHRRTSGRCLRLTWSCSAQSRSRM
jgi:hypothetical protein